MTAAELLWNLLTIPLALSPIIICALMDWVRGERQRRQWEARGEL